MIKDQILPAPALITKKQAAASLQISERTLCHWMNRRLVRYIRIGKTVRFRRADIEGNVGTVFEKGGAL
jgi:excisionase family DNA binding protein